MMDGSLVCLKLQSAVTRHGSLGAWKFRGMEDSGHGVVLEIKMNYDCEIAESGCVGHQIKR